MLISSSGPRPARHSSSALPGLLRACASLIDFSLLLVASCRALGEHGAWAKYQLYEVATHVPTLLHIPGMPTSIAGTTTNNFFELVDLLPVSEPVGV